MRGKFVLMGVLCAGAMGIGAVRAEEAVAADVKPDAVDMEAKRFSAVDTDANGVVSLEEFKAMQEKREETMKQRTGDKYDAEKAAKRPSAEEAFKKLDTDENGTLSKEELAAGRGPRGPRSQHEGKKGKQKNPAAVPQK